jgi:hypothetical protein
MNVFIEKLIGTNDQVKVKFMGTDVIMLISKAILFSYTTV